MNSTCKWLWREVSRRIKRGRPTWLESRSCWWCSWWCWEVQRVAGGDNDNEKSGRKPDGRTEIKN